MTVSSTYNKWEIRYEPRHKGDRNPWIMKCPNEMPEWALYEPWGGCYCRRFKNGRKAISFYNRRVAGNRVVRGE